MVIEQRHGMKLAVVTGLKAKKKKCNKRMELANSDDPNHSLFRGKLF